MSDKQLVEVIQALIRAWENPGPMGSMYQMQRAVSSAKRALADAGEAA